MRITVELQSIFHFSHPGIYNSSNFYWILSFFEEEKNLLLDPLYVF